MQCIVPCRHFYIGLRQGQGLGPIVSHYASPLFCTIRGPDPVAGAMQPKALAEGAPGPPGGPNSLIVMQFSAKK